MKREEEELSDGSFVHSSVFLKIKQKKHCTSVLRPVLLQNTATKPIRSQDQTEEAGQIGCLQHFLRYTRVRGGQKVGGQVAASTGQW